MSFIIILALYPLTSALLSWALKFLKNPMFLDIPTERSNHQTPKARGAGIILIGYMSIIGNQPPKKSIEPIAHIKRIFAYSPSQNIAYIMPEYSV